MSKPIPTPKEQQVLDAMDELLGANAEMEPNKAGNYFHILTKGLSKNNFPIYISTF